MFKKIVLTGEERVEEVYEENENIDDFIEKFRDSRVWKTKKIRMNAEERMKKNNSFNNFILNYYTFWLLTASIFQLTNDNSSLDVYILVASIAVFGFAIYSSTVDYKGKALQYKDSYTQLAHIENELDNLLLKNSAVSLDKRQEFYDIKNRYINELGKHDNQSNKDYILFAGKGVGFKKKNCEYWWELVKIIVYKASLIIFPLIIFLMF